MNSIDVRKRGAGMRTTFQLLFIHDNPKIAGLSSLNQPLSEKGEGERFVFFLSLYIVVEYMLCFHGR